MEMSPLDIVLRHTPSYWQRHPYQNTLYIKVGINKETEEYQTVEDIVYNIFSNVTINKVQRIQHPFACARFQIRKQQLTLINKREPTVNRVILSITDKSKLDSILHYNCDSRRGGFSEEHVLRSNGIILIIKTLSELPCERDSERYQEYLIAYRKCQRSPSNEPFESTIRPTSSTSLTMEDSRSSQTTTSSYKHCSTNIQSNYDEYDYGYDDSWEYLTRDNFAPYVSQERPFRDDCKPGSGWWFWIGAAVIVAYIYWRRSAK